MAAMDFNTILEWLKLSSRKIFAIALASGVILFLNDSAVEMLGFNQVRAEYKPWIGGIFLITIALLAANGVTELLVWGRKKINGYKNLKRWKKRVHDLTPEEKELLSRYINGNTRTQTLRIESGVVNGLISEGIIYQSAKIGYMTSGWAHNIQPWAWEYLNANPELLKGGIAENDPEEVEYDRI